MNISPKEVTIRELVQGYVDNGESGVVGYNGKLNIRPAYQREFVYDDKKQQAVIETIQEQAPLSLIYWYKSGQDKFDYEVIDGQQRIISICRFVTNGFSVIDINTGHETIFGGMLPTVQKQILDYKLIVYVCEGNEVERLNWFKKINIAGVPLTYQELRNATYTGQFTQSAKKYFSGGNPPASNEAKGYVKKDALRQLLLELAISWKCRNEGISGNDPVSSYMSKHQLDKDCLELKKYWRSVIDWAKEKFPYKRKELTQVDWCDLYENHGEDILDPQELESRISVLMADEEVQKKAGIYAYVLNGDEKHLNLRQFSEKDKTTKYEQQKGICPYCKKHFEYSQMQGDHITPWSKGGKTEFENLQMLCTQCNGTKGAK